MKKTAATLLHGSSLLAGLTLFVYLVHQTGFGTIIGYLQATGWGFLLVLGLSEGRNLTRASTWYLAIEPAHRNLSLWRIHNIMLAGEAIKYLTATGPLLGEPAKAAMVRRQVPLLAGFSSVIVENMIYYLTVFAFMLAGLPALVWLVETPSQVRAGAFTFAGGIVLFVAVVVAGIWRRWHSLSRALGFVARRMGAGGGEAAWRRRERLTRLAAEVGAVERNVYDFYAHRRGAFYAIFALNSFAHLLNVVEVWLILRLMELPATLATGFVIEAATKVINMAFFFVPMRAGVYESGNALILRALGLGAGAGVALAIIRKLRAFVWVGYGLGVLLGRAVRK